MASMKLWLWKNFADGKPEYLAFDNPYPCGQNGDPIVLGEPCGYAIFTPSTNGRPERTEEQVMRSMMAARTTQGETAMEDREPYRAEPAAEAREKAKRIIMLTGALHAWKDVDRGLANGDTNALVIATAHVAGDGNDDYADWDEINSNGWACIDLAVARKLAPVIKQALIDELRALGVEV